LALALALSALSCKERQPIHDESAPSCDELQRRYAEVLARAKSCAGATCSKPVDDRLGCACSTFANSQQRRELGELESLRRSWDRTLCNHSVACVPKPCAEPGRAECGASGRCADVAGK
jgi:hypothetical protein